MPDDVPPPTERRASRGARRAAASWADVTADVSGASRTQRRSLLLGTAAGYAAFVLLGVLSRFVPACFALMILVGLVAPLVAARRQVPPTTLGYRRAGLGAALLWALGIGAAMALVTVAAYGWPSTTPPLLGVQLVVGVVVWPLLFSPFQENVFRGWMQPRLERALGGRAGLLVTSAAFAGWHLAPPLSGTATSTISFGTPVALATAFVLGLLTGWARQATGGMVAAWLGHALAGLVLVACGQMTFVQYRP